MSVPMGTSLIPKYFYCVIFINLSYNCISAAGRTTSCVSTKFIESSILYPL